MAPMRRFQIGLLILLALLMPLRSLAVALPDAPAPQEMPCHEPEPAAADDCSTCTDHGCCASYVLPADRALPPMAPRLPQLAAGEQSFSGFVPPQLDPPPVAL